MQYPFFRKFTYFLACMLGAELLSACAPVKISQSLSSSTEVSSNPDFSSSVLLSEQEERIWRPINVDLSKIDADRKLIAFTFDDAPSNQLENILSVFQAYNEENPDCYATATLFCNSMLFDANRRAGLKRALKSGFELGNHTHSHLDLTTLSIEEIRSEIDSTDRYLAKLDGQKLHLLRAPYGKTDQTVKACAYAPIIGWTIDTLDWTGRSAEEISSQVLSNLADGSIVLMHDGYEHTVYALKALLPRLKELGYQVVNVSQLAKAHSCVLTSGNIYVRARKR